jgi:hypothetical protein
MAYQESLLSQRSLRGLALSADAIADADFPLQIDPGLSHSVSFSCSDHLRDQRGTPKFVE